MSGYIGIRKVPTTNDASGVWNIRDAAKAKKDGIWPNAFVSARYWRILQTQNSWNTTAGIYHGALYTIDMHSTQTATSESRLTGTSFAASSIDSDPYAASKAGDNNASTFWACGVQATPHWWSVDFSIPVRVSSLYLLPFNAGGANTGYCATQYALQYSNDNSNWTTVATINTANGSSAQTFTNLNPAS